MAQPLLAYPQRSLMNGARNTMLLSRPKTVAGALVALALIVGAVGAYWLERPGGRAAGPTDPAQTKADLLAVVRGNTEFACDLYGKLRADMLRQCGTRCCSRSVTASGRVTSA